MPCSMGNISSSVSKTYYKMQKMSKMTVFIQFFYSSYFQALWKIYKG